MSEDITDMVTRVTVWPPGATPDDVSAWPWSLDVRWHGPLVDPADNGYGVESAWTGELLDRDGHWHPRVSWGAPECRWDDLHDALAAARMAVAHHRVRGRTWADTRREAT